LQRLKQHQLQQLLTETDLAWRQAGITASAAELKPGLSQGAAFFHSPVSPSELSPFRPMAGLAAYSRPGVEKYSVIF
jgi:hypothetical protein